MKTCTKIFGILTALFSAAAHADLYYETYRGTGAYPTMPYYGGSLTYPTALSSGTVTAINHNWGGGYVLNSGRAEQVLVKYWGYIYVPGSGQQTLTFYNSSDDGFYLRVNNQLVINNWQEQGPGYYNGAGSITLTGGQYYALEAWYYENGGGAAAILYWNQSGSIALVPTSSYYLSQPAPSAPTYTSNITTAQQSRVDAFRARTSTEASIHIDQVGDNNTITIVQKGRSSIMGIGQDKALIDGDGNNITIRQGVDATGNNEIKLRVVGDTNTLNLNQSNTTQGTAIGGNGHYLYTDIYGNSNTLTTQQSNTGGTGGHYAETTISGNSNNVTHLQTGNGNKIMFTNIVGNNNTVSANQKDTGQHYLDLRMTGNGHTANVIQEGSASHRATIDLTNAGGSSSVTLNQNSNTTGQVYSIQQSCANAAGCSTTVTQNQ